MNSNFFSNSVAAKFPIALALFLNVFLAPFVQAEQLPNSYSFVFVGGYGSEKIEGYFDPNIAELHADGVADATKIMPPTAHSVRDNIEFVRVELLKLYQAGGNKPLVIVAHSKGGLEVLNTLLRYPKEFPPAVVAQVTLVQSPLKGTPYADQVMAKWDHSVYALNPLYWIERQTKYGGFSSLTTAEVHADLLFNQAFSHTGEIESLSNRLFYFRSRKAPADVSESLKEFAVANQRYGDNDGMIPTANERLESFAGIEQFGTDLGVFDGIDHLDVVAPGHAPTEERLHRMRDFTRFILRKALAAPSRTLALGMHDAGKASLACESLF